MFSGLTGPPLILMYEMLNVPKVGLDVGGLLPESIRTVQACCMHLLDAAIAV